VIDRLIFPLFIIVPLLSAHALQRAGVHDLLVTPLVIGALIGVTFVLERLRPERPRPERRELSLLLELAHFIFNFELGYGLGLVGIELLQRGLRQAYPSFWPTGWPVALQLLLAVTLYEGTSYWQHRLFHRRERLWAFHALHHSGSHLDLFRSARFHFVDFSTVSFIAFFPLAVVGTPHSIVTLLAVLVSALGLAHHGNVRQRTPAWLDWLVCTPAVHRRHHSRVRAESDANFGNTLMIFDVLFGTYAAPDPDGPRALGIEGPLPEGFWAQLWGPFRAA
jgi:ornithine lipid hydroxylase